MSTEPYYADEWVTLHLGDYRDVLAATDVAADLIVADPPYGETSLDWDRWPDDWPSHMELRGSSMWCFGSMRMFLDRRGDFRGWKLSQDVVWEKNNGSGFHADRFRRIHEHAVHWYRGEWRAIYHDVQRRENDGPDQGAVRGGANRVPHYGGLRANTWTDDGSRMVTSVIRSKNMWSFAINETEKPVGVLTLLIEYACPPGGLVLDPFAGSCSTGVAARAIGRKSVLIEARESQCEAAANRLSQQVMNFGTL